MPGKPAKTSTRRIRGLEKVDNLYQDVSSSEDRSKNNPGKPIADCWIEGGIAIEASRYLASGIADFS